MTQERITAAIVDDEAFVRNALRVYLTQEEDIEVVGEAADGEGALALVAEKSPDVLLLDLQLPDLDGVEVTRRLTARQDSPRIVVVTAHVSAQYVTPALLAGASGYIVKDAEPQRIVTAIREVMDGGLTVDPQITRHLVEAAGRAAAQPAEPTTRITAREQQVLEELCAGSTNGEMASRLYVSESTVKYYLSNLMQKFGCRDRVQLVVAAFRAGVVH